MSEKVISQRVLMNSIFCLNKKLILILILMILGKIIKIKATLSIKVISQKILLPFFKIKSKILMRLVKILKIKATCRKRCFHKKVLMTSIFFFK